ncbi:MAG: ArsR/SmtB family transcription factor [Acidobacteriota bacterium]
MSGSASFQRAIGGLKARSAVFKALGHPTRLFIVEELSRGERCVCELTAMVGADISTVSKHLALLKAAGLVDDDKRGAQVFYRLRVPCVINSFGCIDAVLSRSTATAGLATPPIDEVLPTLVSR